MDAQAPGQSGGPSSYGIRIRGRLGPGWSAVLEGCSIDPAGPDETLITAHVADQAALHGVLARVRDLGLELISVEPVDGE